MNKISLAEAKRLRRRHLMLFACIPFAFLGPVLPRLLPPPPPDWIVFLPAAWFLGFMAVGLLGVWFTERRILRAVDPDDETRRRIVSFSWLRPFGTFLAVNELLRLSTEK